MGYLVLQEYSHERELQSNTLKIKLDTELLIVEYAVH